MFVQENQSFSIIILLCSLFVIVNSHKCVLNPYYHPVCGNDVQTYGNKDILDCLNRQRPRARHVRIIYHRECDPLVCPSFNDLEGSWPDNDDPVCASNGFSYGNIHQVRCLHDFQPEIRILHEGGCTLHETYRALGRNAHIKACPLPRRTFEVNSICTHDNRTYDNPFAAICANGPITMREKVGGSCGCPVQRSCEKVQRMQESLKTATPSERMRFLVCGSDLRTYRSEHHLECSRPFNRYLFLTHFGRCESYDNICPEKLKYTQRATPVCGTDNHSYISFEALLCARYRMNKNLNYLHSGACI